MSDPIAIIKRLEARHQKTLGTASHGGPEWEASSNAGALLAIWWHLEPMISNGGWPAVYFNRCGWAVPLAARGYALLGMHECAARCELAMRLVKDAEERHPGEDHESETWLDSTLMHAINDADWDRLDDGWFELVEGTADAMAECIQRHSLVDGRVR